MQLDPENRTLCVEIVKEKEKVGLFWFIFWPKNALGIMLAFACNPLLWRIPCFRNWVYHAETSLYLVFGVDYAAVCLHHEIKNTPSWCWIRRNELLLFFFYIACLPDCPSHTKLTALFKNF